MKNLMTSLREAGRGQAARAARGDHGVVRGGPGLDRGQRRSACHPGGPGRRPRRAAVGLERLPAHTRLADPGRWLARRPLRRAARVLDRRRRLRAGLGAVRRGAEHRVPDRGPCTAGGVRRAADAERAGAHHRRLPGGGARRRHRLVDGLVGHLDRDRAARRRLSRRRRLMAPDLRDQRPVRGADAGADRRRGARPRARDVPTSGSTGSAPCSRSSGWPGPCWR